MLDEHVQGTLMGRFHTITGSRQKSSQLLHYFYNTTYYCAEGRRNYFLIQRACPAHVRLYEHFYGFAPFVKPLTPLVKPCSTSLKPKHLSRFGIPFAAPLMWGLDPFT